MAVNNEEHTSQNYTSSVTGSIQKKVNILYRHFQLSWSQCRCINKCKATGQKNYHFLVFQLLPSWPFLNHRTKSVDWLHARQGSLRISAILTKVYLLLWSGKLQLKKLSFLQFWRLSLGNKKIKILSVSCCKQQKCWCTFQSKFSVEQLFMMVPTEVCPCVSQL